ncbi:fusion protein [Agrobacterium tumefaciens]|uniref:fusion protein n=1 Tax=Agrobacterium tumefaciens TaxID=358 RepID=UPI001F235709
MANTTWYGDGTATVAVGSRTVTGIGTGWLTEVAGLTPIKVGDKFGIHVGRPIVIESIDSDTQLTLADNWPGPAQTNAPYKVELTSPTIAAVEAMRRLLASLSNGNLDSLSEITIGVDDVPIGVGPGVFGTINKAGLTQGVRYDAWVANLAARAAYNTAAAGFSVLVVDIGDGRSALYFKNSATSGDWSAASYITGPVGPSPTFTASATTLAAGASATAAANPITGGYNLAIGVPAGRSSGYPYTWSTTITDANPGNGFIRANNASMASATLLFVSKTSAAGSALATYLLGLASSTNPTTKGDLILQRISDGAVARFSVTAVTDATNYVKISVTGHSGNTTFTNNGAINLDFSRAGDKGADGAGTGDVVGPAGGVTTADFAAFGDSSGKLIIKAPASIVTNTHLANVPTGTMKGRLTAGTGDVQDLTVAQANQVLGGWEPIGILNLAGQSAGIVNNLSGFLYIRCSASFSIPGTDEYAMIQVSTNNGSSFLTATSVYSFTIADSSFNGSASAVSGSGGAFAGVLLGNKVAGSVTSLFGFNKARNSYVAGHQGFDNATGNSTLRMITQRVIGSAALNALRVITSTGNFTYGEFFFEGVRG